MNAEEVDGGYDVEVEGSEYLEELGLVGVVELGEVVEGDDEGEVLLGGDVGSPLGERLLEEVGEGLVEELGGGVLLGGGDDGVLVGGDFVDLVVEGEEVGGREGGLAGVVFGGDSVDELAGHDLDLGLDLVGSFQKVEDGLAHFEYNLINMLYDHLFYVVIHNLLKIKLASINQGVIYIFISFLAIHLSQMHT